MKSCPTGHRIVNNLGYENQKCEPCGASEYILKSDDPSYQCLPCPARSEPAPSKLVVALPSLAQTTAAHRIILTPVSIILQLRLPQRRASHSSFDCALLNFDPRPVVQPDQGQSRCCVCYPRRARQGSGCRHLAHHLDRVLRCWRLREPHSSATAIGRDLHRCSTLFHCRGAQAV